MLRFRTSILNYFLRVLRQPLATAEGSGAAGQLQDALPATIRSQSTPKELTPTAPGSLPISPLPAGPSLLEGSVVLCNGFAAVEEGEVSFHLLRKVKVDANWSWDQSIRAINTDPLYKVSSASAEKKAAWQKVVMLFSGFVFTEVGSVLHSTPIA